MIQKVVKLSKIKPNPNNPRVIKDDKFRKLVQSIKDFPEMMELREVVVDENMIILGGNMRYKAAIEAGMKEVPIKIAEGLTEKQKQEFIIKDNVQFGEWDWDIIANQFPNDLLGDWGIDYVKYHVSSDEDKNPETIYTKKIIAPTYIPSGPKPAIEELEQNDKVDSLIKEIKEAQISEDVKNFLINAAARHRVFNYQKIAEYYAHSESVVQRLMENSALVIIDYDRAIENGFV